MMIGPTTYVDMELRGKSRDAAMREINALRREIRRLKKVIEEEPNSEEMMIHPSPDVQISVSRDYLEAAREYFEAQRWEYEPSQEEIKDKEFNARLTDIESIIIEYSGYLCGGEKRKIAFDGEKILVEKDYLMRIPCEEDLKKDPADDFHGMERTELIEELADLHVGEWKKEYDDLTVLDGIQWSVVIKFSSGKDYKCCGSNRFPYNFYGFLDLMGMSEVDL